MSDGSLPEQVFATVGLSQEALTLGCQFLIQEVERRNAGSHPLLRQLRAALNPRSADDERLLTDLGVGAVAAAWVKEWPGSQEMLDRLAADERGWNSTLYEARVAALFASVGWTGRFVVTGDQPASDLVVQGAGAPVVVECRQSSELTPDEEANREIWLPTTKVAANLLRTEFPCALLRVYPTRNADRGDHGVLLTFIRQAITAAKASWALPGPPFWRDNRLTSPDKAFGLTLLTGTDPNAFFDEAAREAPGIELPSNIQPAALRLVLDGRGGCAGLWWATVHAPRDWPTIEKRVLQHMDEKASQLNRVRASDPALSLLPGLVWIQHPALTEASPADTTRLRLRINGRLRSADPHFAAVDGVALTNWRTVLNREGIPLVQWRIAACLRDEDGPLARIPLFDPAGHIGEVGAREVLGVRLRATIGPFPWKKRHEQNPRPGK